MGNKKIRRAEFTPDLWDSAILRTCGFDDSLSRLPRKLSVKSKCKQVEYMFARPVVIGSARAWCGEYPPPILADWLADCASEDTEKVIIKKIGAAISNYDISCQQIVFSHSKQKSDLLALEAALHECAQRLFPTKIPSVSHQQLADFVGKNTGIDDVGGYILETAGRLALLKIAVSQVEIPPEPRATKPKSRLFKLISDLIQIHDENTTLEEGDRQLARRREFIEIICSVHSIKLPTDIDRLIRRALERQNLPVSERGDSAAAG